MRGLSEHPLPNLILMITGIFLDFNIPYSKHGVLVLPQNQAENILKKAEELIIKGNKGVAIIYSANYGQTREIEKIYFMGGWNTQTNGSNQAAVMNRMESLLGNKYSTLRGKMRILPITTMNAYEHPVSPWNDDVLMGIVTTDLERIKIYLEAGWNVLGWQNQNTVNNSQHPYAVGGGISKLPPTVSDKIQNTLMGYARTYNC